MKSREMNGMFTFANSGIQVPLPTIDVIENEEGFCEVKVVDTTKTEVETNKTNEHLQYMKTLESLKELEISYQKSSEELAIEKNKHADTLAQNNKHREIISELNARIDTLEKLNASFNKQQMEATQELEENSKLLQKRDDYMSELRKRIGEAESHKEKSSQTIKELSRTNETLKKNLEEAKNQLAKLATEHETAKKNWGKEQNKLQHELKVQFNELETKIDQLAKARARLAKLEPPKTRSRTGLYENKKKSDYTTQEAQSKSIIKYNK